MWKKLTQVHVVENVSECASFWTERFGFRKVIQVPGTTSLKYVALKRDDAELHYRSRESLLEELPALGPYAVADSTLMTIELQSLDEVMDQLGDVEVIVPRRRSFYGNNEVVIRAPGGQIVLFTAPGDEPTLQVANPFGH